MTNHDFEKALAALKALTHNDDETPMMIDMACWLIDHLDEVTAALQAAIEQPMTAPVQNETGRDVGLVPYYDYYGTKTQKIGRKIYHKALSDRRGFREDQVGIDCEDDVWLDIFEDIGVAAIDFVNGGSDD